jgi:hypothetical protein
VKARQPDETEEWRRWANTSAQEQIIQRVEALLEANDLAEGTRILPKLQAEWAAVSTATPDKAQALWDRFRTARNELRRRCDAYLAENLEKKRALCTQVEGIGDSTSWNETADLVKRLQAEWKAIGPVPAKHAKTLWRQFREPCDRFFTRRKEHFDRIDAERRENATQLAGICERAEALVDSTDWDATAAAFRQLQNDWKRAGPAPRSEADALWNRFRAACDRFFEQHRRRHERAREELARQARAVCETLEAAATASPVEGDAAEGVAKTIDAAWSDWVRLDLSTLPDAAALEQRLHAACEQIASTRPEALRGTRLDLEVTGARRQKLCNRLEEMIPSAVPDPRTLSVQEMALALRERLGTHASAGKGSKPLRPKDVAEEVERISASWARLGPPLGEEARALTERFERALARLRAGKDRGA